jgi:hypothetical protein
MTPTPNRFDRKQAFPGLPEALWRHGYVSCVQLCGWTDPQPGALWVDLAEAILASLGTTPSRGYAFSGRKEKTADLVGPETRGGWKRIRDRAVRMLGTTASTNVLELRTNYDYRVGETAQDASVLVKSGLYFPLRKSQISIAVSVGVAASPFLLLEQIGPILAPHTNAKWGAAFAFPSAAGAEFYLDGATFAGPEVRALGSPSIVLADHEERVHRANYRTSTEFSYHSGYVREVYEINLLSEEHLRAPLLGSTVRAYAESLGSLRPSSLRHDLFEWRLDGGEVTRARADWETSGLVLSADCQPFRWQ